jgi:hypothetical protein
MQFQDLFAEYYTQYRGDSQIPTVTDPEWALGVMAGNSGIRRWANVDAEYWDVLWTTAVAESFSSTWTGNGASPITLTFDCPDSMKAPGGFVQMTDPVSLTFIHIPVLKLQDIQFQAMSSPFAYFIGNQQQGFQLTINFSGSSNFGWIIDFPMYRKPTYFDASQVGDGSGNVNEDGTTVTECPDSNYLINFMLGRRLFSTRNPFFQQAYKDAETSLRGMQLRNGTGTPGDEWNLNDHNKTGGFGF